MVAPILDLADFADQLRLEGWATTAPLFDAPYLDSLTNDVGAIANAGDRAGTRNLLELPAVRELATSSTIQGLASVVLGDKCFVVRAILFDKTPGANWKVTWHQDLTIAVRDRRDVEGFGPWSVKEGVTHVQPPVEILERMLAIRLHLDECGSENGPVRVIARSHASGRLSGPAIDVWKAQSTGVDCTVARGGVLAFSPLLLHSSSPARRPQHRRVIHLEFAATSLPRELQWYYATDESRLAGST